MCPPRYHSADSHRRRYWKNHAENSYVCPDCGDESGPFFVHHIDGNIGNGAMQNLVALCWDCHKTRHEGLDTDERPVEGWKRAFKLELFVD